MPLISDTSRWLLGGRPVSRSQVLAGGRSAPLRSDLVLLLLTLAVALLLSGCERSPTGPDAEVSFHTLAKTTVAGVQAPHVREVVRDQASFEAIWAQLWGPGAAAAPSIDFGREMVVVASAALVCFDVVAVERIKVDGNELVIELVEATNTSLCLCGRYESTFHIVRLRRFAGPERFVARPVPPTCPS